MTGVTETEAAGYDNSTDGKYFEVSDSSGGNTKYFNNMQAALNYAFTAEAYTSDDKVTATIKLLDDVTDGSAWIIGGKAMLDDQGTKYLSESEIADSLKKFDLTIDLNGKGYKFSNFIGNGNANGVGSIKAIRTYVKSGTSGTNSLLTIKNGTLSLSNQTSTKFERLATTYTSCTIDGVTIEAGGAEDQKVGTKGAIIAHDTGTLTLQNGTTFTGLKDNGVTTSGVETGNYFAVTGRTENPSVERNRFMEIISPLLRTPCSSSIYVTAEIARSVASSIASRAFALPRKAQIITSVSNIMRTSVWHGDLAHILADWRYHHDPPTFRLPRSRGRTAPGVWHPAKRR